MKNVRFILFVICVLFLTIGCQNNLDKPTLYVPEDKVGLVGYGSLSSKENVEEYLGHSYNDSLYQIHLNGFKRTWNFAASINDPNLPEEFLKYESFYLRGGDTIPFQKIIFLNIIPDKKQSINCLLYFVNKEELEILDNMEIGYERIDVTNQISEFDVKKGSIFAYKAKPEYVYYPETDTLTGIIDQEYADLVLGSYDRLGLNARKEFDASTQPIDTNQLAKIIRIKVRD